MTVLEAELTVFELAVGRSGAAGARDIFLFICKSSVDDVKRESEAAGSEPGLTKFIYHGDKMRMTAIKAKAKRVFRSIYL